MNHLKVFDSLCYGHILVAKRKKLEDLSNPLILLGYHPTEAYRLFNPLNNEIEICRDVIVLENEHWDWEKKEQGNYRDYVTLQLNEEAVNESANDEQRDSSDEDEANVP